MKVVLIENTTQEILGAMTLQFLPRSGDWLEFDQRIYAIHRIRHGQEGIKLDVIAVR